MALLPRVSYSSVVEHSRTSNQEVAGSTPVCLCHSLKKGHKQSLMHRLTSVYSVSSLKYEEGGKEQTYGKGRIVVGNVVSHTKGTPLQKLASSTCISKRQN